jgi:hypothetical protein
MAKVKKIGGVLVPSTEIAEQHAHSAQISETAVVTTICIYTKDGLGQISTFAVYGLDNTQWNALIDNTSADETALLLLNYLT